MNIFRFFKDIKKIKELKKQEEVRIKKVYEDAKRIWNVLNDSDKWAIREDKIPFSLSKIFSDGIKNDVYYKLKTWVNNSRD